MAEELVLYTNPMSRGRVARWMLEEVGEPYRPEILDWEAVKAPAYLAVNPMGKVPAIRHGETVVTENAAICAYLADAFPQAGLAPPPGSAQRGPYYRWLFFAAGPFESAMITKALGWEAPPDRARMVGWGSTAAVLDTLEQALKGRDYLAGDRFTAADLYMGAQLGWQLAFGQVEPREAFTAYAARVQGRAAFKRASEMDDALLPPKT